MNYFKLMKTMFLAVLFLLVFYRVGYAQCEVKTFKDLTIEVIEQENGESAQALIVKMSDTLLYRFEFDRLGGGGCEALFIVPDQDLFGVHWNEGSAGTSSIYSRQMLYLWGLVGNEITALDHWILKESYNDEIFTERTYGFSKGDLIFEGRERIELNKGE